MNDSQKAEERVKPTPWKPKPLLPASDSTATECERLFQNGGPRAYELWRDGSRELVPVTLSASRAARNLNPGGMVCARKKVGGKYVWMRVIRRRNEAVEIQHGTSSKP